MKKVIVLIVLVLAMTPMITNAQITQPLDLSIFDECNFYGFEAASAEEEAWGSMTEAEFNDAWDFYTDLCLEFGSSIDEPTFE